METAHESSEVKPKTWRERFSFLMTWRFLQILLLGQFLSLCITATNVTSEELAVNYGVNMPTTQTFLNYGCLMIVYIPYTIYKRGVKGFLRQLKKRGLWYILLALIDVEGNYFVVKAYQYTTLMSAMLLDAWSIPVVMVLSFFFLKTRYHVSQFIGVAISIIGLGLLVRSDAMAGADNSPVPNAVKGDLFMILGATFYGISNTMEEFFVRKHPLYEVIGMMGLFGTIINGIQLAILERNELSQFVQANNPTAIGMWLVYTFAMFSLYTCAPILFRLASATLFNLSLLTSDFYGLIFGLFLFQAVINFLYPIAYVLVIIGIIIYNVWPAPTPKIGSFDHEAALKDQLETEGQYRHTVGRDLEGAKVDSELNEVFEANLTAKE